MRRSRCSERRSRLLKRQINALSFLGRKRRSPFDLDGARSHHGVDEYQRPAIGDTQWGALGVNARGQCPLGHRVNARRFERRKNERSAVPSHDRRGTRFMDDGAGAVGQQARHAVDSNVVVF
jgi:hypothetical protein